MDISFRELIDSEVSMDYHLKALKALERDIEHGTHTVRPLFSSSPPLLFILSSALHYRATPQRNIKTLYRRRNRSIGNRRHGTSMRRIRITMRSGSRSG